MDIDIFSPSSIAKQYTIVESIVQGVLILEATLIKHISHRNKRTDDEDFVDNISCRRDEEWSGWQRLEEKTTRLKMFHVWETCEGKEPNATQLAYHATRRSSKHDTVNRHTGYVHLVHVHRTPSSE